MNKRMVRIIALILCAVMILGMIPLLVHAETVHPRSITQDGRTFYFDSFEDLKELAAGTYGESVYFQHQGGEDLVISEDLTLPASSLLYAKSSNLYIPEGVTLLANNVSVKSLVVEGNLEGYEISGTEEILVKANGSLYAYESIDTNLMTVEGEAVADTLNAWHSLDVSGYVHAYQALTTAQLSGAENISGWTSITISRTIGFVNDYGTTEGLTTAEKLESLIAIANSFRDDPRVTCVANLRCEDLVFTGYTEFPANCNMDFETNVTIAEGAQLIFQGTMTTNQLLTIQGELQVNDLVIYAMRENGRLILEESGTLTYNTLRVSADFQYEVLGLLQGLDRSKYSVIKKAGKYTNWEVIYVGHLEQLAAPAELTWGDSDTGSPATFRWKQEGGTVVKYELRFLIGNTLYLAIEGTYEAPAGEAVYHSVDMSRLYTMESGTYYVRLTTLGDNITCRDSETVMSEPFEYVKPKTKLATCKGLAWQTEARTPTWTEIDDSEYLRQYELEYYFCTTRAKEPRLCTSAFDAADAAAALEDAISRCGEGFYSFKVRAISSDITQISHGNWSEMSPFLRLSFLEYAPAPEELAWGYEAVTVPDETSGSLVTVKHEGSPSSFCWKQKGGTTVKYDLRFNYGNILNPVIEGTWEAPAGEDVYHSVDMSRLYNMKSGTYYVILTTVGNNTTNSDSENVMSEPFEYVKPKTKLAACKDLAWDAETRSPSWTEISDRGYLQYYELEYYYKPAEYWDPELCGTVTAADAAAALEDAISRCGEGLYYFKVRAISSDITQIYHGSWSELSPALQVDAVKAIPGDMNGDGVVDDSDVAQLLWHTLFPENYDISGNADINGDGTVDDADVAYLLWHTLFPEAYPIS